MPLPAIPLIDRESQSWQEQLQKAIRTPLALAAEIGIELKDLPYSLDAQEEFPLLVPHAFAARIKRGDPQDPLLRQVLASRDELVVGQGFGDDPVGEVERSSGDTAVIKKYQGRALLVLTGQCAVNCRYCFRRHYPYEEQRQSTRERDATLNQLLDDDGLKEIILSGGDPLVLPDKSIARIFKLVETRRPDITLRIHSRLPIVIPDRISDSFLALAGASKLKLVVVLHANHPQEIDHGVVRAIGALKHHGVLVLNQSVMLAKVNDDSSVLAELNDRLFAAGALPYYIHLLDRVAGAVHFEVEEVRAQKILGELAECRPGYLVPKLARELAGADSKRELPPLYGELNSCG
ncbi:MAG: EF-P beta-lysylation protein EpmB [Pseudomonadota bacterium]